jgi:hypothetical protein
LRIDSDLRPTNTYGGKWGDDVSLTANCSETDDHISIIIHSLVSFVALDVYLHLALPLLGLSAFVSEIFGGRSNLRPRLSRDPLTRSTSAFSSS